MCYFKCSNMYKVSCSGSRVWMVCSGGMAFWFLLTYFLLYILAAHDLYKDKRLLNCENYSEK